MQVFGTEDREVAGPAIAPAARIFEYVVFQAKDVLKLEFVKAAPESVSGATLAVPIHGTFLAPRRFLTPPS